MKKILFTTVFYAALFTSAMADTQTQTLNESVSFQAVTWQGNDVVASGTSGGIYSSADNGLHWQKIPGPLNSESLQFRDNQRLDNGRLIVMSAGEGDDSGIFISDNNGESWERVAQGESPEAFYDCFYMLDEQYGWLYGDADNEGMFVLSTTDGAKHWQRESMPFAAQLSEGGFASSGTCLSSFDKDGVVIGTGNGEKSRLLVFSDEKWQTVVSPIDGGEASGIFSVQSNGQAVFVSGGSLKLSELPAQAWLYHTASDKWVALPTLPLKGSRLWLCRITSRIRV